jgi:UDP:flavonoid glycosyltransferase YjiC (YdhE family)
MTKEGRMRVLFVSSPGIGHVFPMVPLAWALRTSGHDVMLATAGSGLVAAQAGLPVVDVLPGFDFESMRAHIARENPELVKAATGERQLHDVRDVAAIFGRMSGMLADPVVATAQRWQPDVVVQSQLQGAGLLAAAKLGVPVVDQGFGFARTDGLASMLHRHMAEVFERHGVRDLPRHTMLDVAPPSMLETQPHGWSMGYVPYNGGAVLPEWLTTPSERPRIAVTLGTVAPKMTGLDPLRTVIDAAHRTDAEFVLALGDADTATLGTLPANVRTAGWVPLNALLATCHGIVHHGGAGTTLTSLACGVPQLVLPNGADRFINAEAVRRRNVGLVAAAEDVTDAMLAFLLGSDEIRRAADEVRQEISTMPTPAEIARRMAGLAATAAARESPA